MKAASFLLCSLLVFTANSLRAGTLTVENTPTGQTPQLLGYNLAHFFPGGNAPMWFRYSGVNGARLFMSPNSFGESVSNDDLAPWGDGVDSLSAFELRRMALRASQAATGISGNGPYINWTHFSHRYTLNLSTGRTSNQVVPATALAKLREMGIDILVNITAAPNSLPIQSPSDWSGKWELWQHFYAQAYYLAANHDVCRFQIYNEPDMPDSGLPGNGHLTATGDYVMRLQLASDAIQCAVADVNSHLGKTLAARVLGPVTVHGHEAYQPEGGEKPGWGKITVAARRSGYADGHSTWPAILHQYDFHKYGGTFSSYSATVGNIRDFIAADTPGEAPLPISVSEFNTNTGAVFETLAETLDSPSKFMFFGAMSARLIRSEARELYCFKFGQTPRSGTNAANETVAKNGMLFTDNWTAPYNVGGSTKAAEVWRFGSKGFKNARPLLAFTKSEDATLDPLEVIVSYDPVAQRYHILSTNSGNAYADLSVDASRWEIPAGGRFTLEELSESRHGSIRTFGTIDAEGFLADPLGNRTASQPANSTWLFTVPAQAPASQTTLLASADATVADGSLANSANGSSHILRVANTASVNATGRTAALLRFQLPGNISVSKIQTAVLSIQGSVPAGKTAGRASVHGLPNSSTGWTETSVTWRTAPNLADGNPGGPSISNNFVEGGDATNLASGAAAFLCGHLQVEPGAPAALQVDVTDFLKSQSDTTREAVFLLARENRHYGDPVDAEALDISSREAGGGNAPQLVIVLKNDSNSSPPTIGSISSQVLHKNVVSDPLSFTVADHETAPASLIVTARSSDPALVPEAGLVISGLGSNRSLAITPAPNQTGTATITLQVSDGTYVASTSFPVSVVETSALPLAREATVESDVNAGADINEAALGYVSTKHGLTGPRRKAYYQFDVGDLQIDSSGSATFTVGFVSSNQQRVQLWALNDAYSHFASTATWNTAQANDTASNDLLTAGNLTATPIGPSVLLKPTSDLLPQSFSIPGIAGFAKQGRVTLVLAGVDDPSNHSGGARYSRDSASLRVPLQTGTPQSISFPGISPRIYGAGTFTLNASASSGLPVSYTSSNTSVARVSGATVTILAPGTTTLVADQLGNSTTAVAASVSRTLVVAPKPLTLSFPRVARKTYNRGTAAVITGNLSGLVPGDTVTLLGSGNFTSPDPRTGIPVTASIGLLGADARKYSILQPVGLAGTIIPKTLSITGLSGNSKVYDGTPAATVSGTPVVNGLLSGDSVSLGGSPVFLFTDFGVGSVKPITASGLAISGPQAANYALQQPRGLTGNILAAGAPPIATPATVTGTFNAPLAFQTGFVGSPTSFAVSSGTLPAGLILNSGTGMISGMPAAAGLSNATITASNAAGSGSALLVFNIAKTTQTISGLPPSFQTAMGGGNLTLSASASSRLPVVYVSSNTSVALVSGSVVSILSAGNTTITAVQPGNANWIRATPVSQALSVAKGNQTISFAAIAPVDFGAAPFAIRALATSRLRMTFTSSNPSVATVAGNMLTVTGVGSTIITASQAGNTSYNAALPVAQPLVVNKRRQTVSLSAIPAKLTTDAPFTVSATVTSGLPVALTSSNTSVATVSGNLVTIAGAGFTVLTASQHGDSQTLEAPAVLRTLTVRIPLPGVVTGNATSPILTGAILSGEVSSLGTSNLTERGFFVSRADGFANGIGTKIALSGNFGVGSFTANASRLTANTTYYFKAYAVGVGGTAYGLQQSFFTNPDGAPPILLKSLHEGNATVALRWNFSGNATSYDVEASLSANMANSSITRGGNETTSSFALGNNTVNFFRVRAVRGATLGPWSASQAIQVLTLPPSAIRYAGLALNPGNFTVAGIFGASNEAGLRVGTTAGNATQIQLLDSSGHATQAIFFDSSKNGWTQGSNNAAGATPIPRGRGFILQNTSDSQSNQIILSGVPFAAGGNITLIPNGAGRNSLFAMARSNPTGLSTLNLAPGTGIGSFLAGTSLTVSDSLQVIDAGGARTLWYHCTELRWYVNGAPSLWDPMIPAGSGLLFLQAPGSSWSTWRIPGE